MLMTAPMTVVSMLVFAKPCPEINRFIPSVSATKIVPGARRYSTSVSATEMRTNTVKLFPRIFSARSRSPFPRLMDAIGAPPLPTSIANALMSVRIGTKRPAPVSAAAPTSAMWPI